MSGMGDPMQNVPNPIVIGNQWNPMGQGIPNTIPETGEMNMQEEVIPHATAAVSNNQKNSEKMRHDESKGLDRHVM